MATNAVRKDERYDHSVGYSGSSKAEVRPRLIRVLNTDYSYLDPAQVSKYASNDEKFNAEYSKQGLQPQGIGVDKNNKNTNNQAAVQETQNHGQSFKRNLRKRVLKVAEKDSPSLAKKGFLKVRVSAVNASIFAWATPLWIVQLIFSIMSLVALGAATAVQATINEIPFAGSFLSTINSIIGGVASVLGFNIDLASSAQGLIFIPQLVVFGIGLFTLMIMNLQYTLSFLKPLSGNGASLKMGMLMMALIGYFMPLFNLFPWALFYAAAVWKYPR